MRDTHVGENAELYALGLLNDIERAQVEAHVANCAECLRRLGQAEETVLDLERETPAVPLPPNARAPQFVSRRNPPWWIGAVAAAAALIFGYLLPHPQAAPVTAQLAMLHSHFNHAQFQGNGPLAKVLYARDGSWYYVVVEGSHAYTIDGISSSGTTVLGTTKPGNGTSEFFAPHTQRFDIIELTQGSTVVERAQTR